MPLQMWKNEFSFLNTFKNESQLQTDHMLAIRSRFSGQHKSALSDLPCKEPHKVRMLMSY